MKQLLRQENECGRGVGALEDHMHGQVSECCRIRQAQNCHPLLAAYLPAAIPRLGRVSKNWSSFAKGYNTLNVCWFLLLSHLQSDRLQRIDLLTVDVRNYPSPVHTYLINAVKYKVHMELQAIEEAGGGRSHSPSLPHRSIATPYELRWHLPFMQLQPSKMCIFSLPALQSVERKHPYISHLS